MRIKVNSDLISYFHMDEEKKVVHVKELVVGKQEVP